MTTNAIGQFVRDNLAGQRFGTATVGEDFKKMPNGGTKWFYTCDCGGAGWAWAETLKREPNFCCKECRKKRLREARTTHGMRYTSEYRTWVAMVGRCTYPTHRAWKDYGGRGIVVCEEWKTFENFFRDMGAKPSSAHSIERKDNSKGYSKDNCIWSTVLAQANNRRSNVTISLNGRTQTISQWSRETGIDKTTIRKRLLNGWTPEQILSLDDFRKQK